MEAPSFTVSSPLSYPVVCPSSNLSSSLTVIGQSPVLVFPIHRVLVALLKVSPRLIESIVHVKIDLLFRRGHIKTNAGETYSTTK